MFDDFKCQEGRPLYLQLKEYLKNRSSAASSALANGCLPPGNWRLPLM